MKNLLFSVLLPFVLFTDSKEDHYMIVGTYTGAKSEGIYVYSFNSADGSVKEVSHVKTSNPSFVTVSPDKKYVYAIHENQRNGNGGEISAFAFDKNTGTLTLINEQPTGGDHPCYVEVDKTGKWVFAGNYSSGSLSVIPVLSDGSLGKPTTHIQHYGSGANKERQDKPHVHCTYISPDNRWLFVPDLGIDKVMIYSFDANTGFLKEASPAFAASEPGAGPRHITFHPNSRFVYLIEELTGEVLTYEYNNGQLKKIQTISTIKKGAKGFAGSADIHVSPDGKFLYASNRGDFNNIAIYKIDAKSGKLTIVGFQPTLGKAPRNFNFDPSGNYLLVANQESDEIVVFKRDLKKGLLTDTGNRVSVGKPVCIKWAE